MQKDQHRLHIDFLYSMYILCSYVPYVFKPAAKPPPLRGDF